MEKKRRRKLTPVPLTALSPKQHQSDPQSTWVGWMVLACLSSSLWWEFYGRYDYEDVEVKGWRTHAAFLNVPDIFITWDTQNSPKRHNAKNGRRLEGGVRWRK